MEGFEEEQEYLDRWFRMVMNEDSDSSKIQFLCETIIEAKESYYTSGDVIMQDYTYDLFERELEKLSPNHWLLEEVGYSESLWDRLYEE